MDLPAVRNTSLDLKRYLLTVPVSNKRKYEASLSSYCQGACLVPVSDADLDEDPLFLDYTLNVITPRCAKRRRLTLIKFYSSESVNPGDTHGCSTSSLLDQYLTKIIPLVRNTKCERSVLEQLSPVIGTQPFNCMKMGAEQCTSAWNETNINYYSDYSSIFSEKDNAQRPAILFSTVEGRSSTPIPPPRTKRITKSSENITKGKKRKNDDDKTLTTNEDAQDKTRKSSYPIPPPRKKACHRSKDKNRTSEDQFSNNGIIFSDYICGSIKQYKIPIKETCTGIITTCVTNGNDCERLQSENSTVSGSEPFLNPNSLLPYHLRHNVGTKRPVMGRSAIFISIDLMSFDVLAEINRKVHLKYGDRKRRRIKTNGILNSEFGAKKKIMETSEVFRKLGPCRKLLAFKKLMSMKKDTI
ncbi:hypothetical protein ACJMK2_006835 [Sinanodonta woodiana]|uniref:Uncharacterized protein n=1 Tax=Sinanodonta woodiana TaxID=1069815 RepID=A0ABD3VUD1_SINWO